VAEREAALQSGRLEAVLSYGSGQRSTVTIRFDLRAENNGPRYHASTTYTGQEGSSTSEQVTIGDQSWQRQRGGAWAVSKELEGAQGRLRQYLPRASTASAARVQNANPRATTLAWYDAAFDSDVTLQVETGTGIPSRLVRVARATGTTLTVNYSGWNTAVEISAPTG
jgi:hypothetical protein